MDDVVNPVLWKRICDVRKLPETYDSEPYLALLASDEDADIFDTPPVVETESPFAAFPPAHEDDLVAHLLPLGWDLRNERGF